MTSVVSEAAKNSCVLPMGGQNGLVAEPERIVETGASFAIHNMYDMNVLRGQPVYLIGDTDTIEAFGQALYERVKTNDKYTAYFFKVNDDASGWYGIKDTIICRRTILDIPKEYRSKGIVICFDEPSYNGRQCLFHLYGAESIELCKVTCKCILKPYPAFIELIEGIQGPKMDSAIIFVPKALQNDKLRPIMWCSAKLEEKKKPCPPVSQPPVTQDPVTTQLAALTEAITKLTALIEAKLA